MRIIYSYPGSNGGRPTRVRTIPVNPQEGDDVIVEQSNGTEYVKVRSFNSLSNDYAYTSAGEYAKQIASKPSKTT